jgi:hypothetical protein
VARPQLQQSFINAPQLLDRQIPVIHPEKPEDRMIAMGRAA